jgi:hypothetical protein
MSETRQELLCRLGWGLKRRLVQVGCETDFGSMSAAIGSLINTLSIMKMSIEEMLVIWHEYNEAIPYAQRVGDWTPLPLSGPARSVGRPGGAS